MNLFQRVVERFFTPHRPLPAGIYQYQAPPDSKNIYRIHLRLEPSGEGVAIINARTVLHLNQTAAEFIYHIINQTPQEEIVRQVSRRYRASREDIQKDLQNLQERLEILVTTPDLDPVTYLDFERREPYSGEFSAPYRLDCALTYQVVAGEHAHLAPLERVARELLTEEWKTILQKAWQAGIPHVIFTGGEPTLRNDLIDLVAFSEQLGMVSGLLTSGVRLTEKEYLHRLLQSGLDHLMLLLDPSEDQSWEALRDVLGEDIFTTVHLTLTSENKDEMTGLIGKLAEMGVRSLSLSTSDPGLKDELQAASHTAADRGISLMWDLPVPYSTFHPVALELQEAGQPVSGAGKAWLYVEPDGDVLPAQGVNQLLGNLLSDPWEKIWKLRE